MKKPFYKKWWFIAIVAFFLLSIVFAEDEENENPELETESPSIEEVKEPEEAPEEEVEPEVEKEEAEPEVEKESESIASKEFEQLALQLIQDNFEDSGFDVTLEGDRFLYVPQNNDLVYGLVLISEGEMSRDEWDNVIESMKFLSESTADLVGPGYTHNVINPANKENTLLIVSDGILIYDAVAQ